MKKFVVIYTASTEVLEKMQNASPEDHKKSMEPWMEWMKKCGEGLVDMGAPLGNGQKVTPEGNSPSEGKIVGYSILQAQTMDGALKLLDGHPHLGWNAGCGIEVYEAMPMPG